MNTGLREDYALGLLQNAIRYFEQQGDGLGVAIAKLRMGYVYTCIEIPALATKVIGEALPVFRQLDESEHQVRALIALNNALTDTDLAQQMFAEEGLKMRRHSASPAWWPSVSRSRPRYTET